jgi:hypothetical protein
LVHALGRSADGAKLPSAGLCLNASKAASHLDDATILLHTVTREAEIRPLKVGSSYEVHECGPHGLQPSQIRWRCESSYRHSDHLRCVGRSPDADHLQRCRSVESSVDDLRTGRGVVLGRAVPMLRSVETQPLTGGFVLMAGRILTYFLF